MSSVIKTSGSNSMVYKYMKLPNKLQAILVSDPEADMASAAMDVGVGSALDPRDRPGLAHFCEHMLFMGTETYPVENEYSVYLKNNAGHSNAYTALNNTNYFFQVSNQGFEGALDRFSCFFKCPTFNEDSTSREMNAVDSENKKNLQSDLWRFHQLIRSEANVDSTLNHFSTGNMTTLNHPTIRKDLLKFHKDWYSSNIMKLV